MENNEMDLDNLEEISGGSKIFSNSSERIFNLIDPYNEGYMDQLGTIKREFKNLTHLNPREEESLERQLRKILSTRAKSLTVIVTKNSKGIQVRYN